MNTLGIDLNREPEIAGALARAIRPRGVGATPIAARTDRTRGFFLVAPAPNLIDGVLCRVAVVVFLSDGTVRSAATNPTGLRFPPADGFSGDRAGGDSVRDEFAVAGKQFAVGVPKASVSVPGAGLPWIMLAGGFCSPVSPVLLVSSGCGERGRSKILTPIFNISADLVAVANFGGHFIRVNSAAEQVLGYTEKELLARLYLDFVHPDDRERTAAEAAATDQGKTTLSFENRLVRRDGCVRVSNGRRRSSSRMRSCTGWRAT
jgi:PAS domain S-box-containing protein